MPYSINLFSFFMHEVVPYAESTLREGADPCDTASKVGGFSISNTAVPVNIQQTDSDCEFWYITGCNSLL